MLCLGASLSVVGAAQLDVLSGVYWAAGAACVTGLLLVARRAWRSAIREEVQPMLDAAVKPLYDRLSKHLDDEEAQLKAIHAHLNDISRNKEQDHRRIWDAIDKLRR